MVKKEKSKNDSIVYIVAILILMAVTSSPITPTDTTQQNNTTGGDVPASIGGGFWLGGGGGGGGSPPAPTGGDDCVDDCPPVWVEDEPIRTSSTGLLDVFSIRVFAPMLVTGKWNCDGVCQNEAELCLFNPTDVIPDGGYTNKDNPPDCVCLKPQAGGCNFYDDNYGVGEENIICGGSCPYNSQCMRYDYGTVDVCQCMVSSDSDECGMHYPEQYTPSPSGELVVDGEIGEVNCYGKCDIATLCTFDYQYDENMLVKVPVCYCPESPAQQDDEEPDTITYCESIENPRSQSDCDIGACTVTMYGVECLYGIDARSGNTQCYCGVPEDVEPIEPLETSILPDKILTPTSFLRR